MSTEEQQLFQRHRLTVDEYYQMGEAGILAPDARVELIEGEIIDMPPIGSPHAVMVDELTQRVIHAVAGRAALRVQNPVRLDRRSEPVPDLALLRPPLSRYRSAHPTPADVLLLIEVSASTFAYDRRVKVSLYARHGIPEVWQFDLSERVLHVFRDPAAHEYRDAQIIERLSSLAPAVLPGVAIDLADLFGEP